MSNKNPGNVAGGLKATIHNPNTSEAAKESAEERLGSMPQETGAADSEKNTGNVIGGYKATISNPKTSEGAKEHAREALGEFQQHGDTNDPAYVPEK